MSHGHLGSPQLWDIDQPLYFAKSEHIWDMQLGYVCIHIYIYTYIVILHILTGLVEICNQTLKPIQVLERRRTSQSRAAATANGTATGTHPSLFHGSETWNRASFEILDPQQLRHFMLISRIIFIWLKIHPRLSVAVKIPDFLKPGVSGNGVYQCINPISG